MAPPDRPAETARTGRRDLWQSLEMRDDPAALADLVAREFGASARALLESDRRGFLKTMAASFALAGLSGCDWTPPQHAESRARGSEHLQTDDRVVYATSVDRNGWAVPVLADVVGGRPVRLQGNPDHPASTSAADVFAQAEVLRLYDPDRSRSVRHFHQPVGLNAFRREMLAVREHAAETAGADLALLTGPVTSPTAWRRIRAVLDAYPAAQWYVFDPLPLAVPPRWLDLGRARAIVSLDHDFLGPGAHQVPYAHAFAEARGAAGPQALFVAEPTPTLTGLQAGADRLALEAGDLERLAEALLSGDPAGLPEAAGRWVREARSALEEAADRGLVTAGDHASPRLHALSHRITRQFGGGALVQGFRQPPFADPGQGLEALLARDDVATLVMIDTNPVYHAAADLPVEEWLLTVPRIVHAGLYPDETARRSHWHLPLAHPLERWGDGLAVDGTYTLRQPLVQPLFDGWSELEVLTALLEPGTEAAPDRHRVRATYEALRGGAVSDAQWRRVVEMGFDPEVGPDLAEAPSPPPPPPPPTGEAAAVAPVADGLEAVFRPDPSLWDGAYANCAWMLELPKPLSKITWDTAVLISPLLAAERGLDSGSVVTLETAAGAVRAPIWVMPGQAARTLTIELGGGREHMGRLAREVGFNGFRLRPADGLWRAPVTGLRVVEDARHDFATTQIHGAMRDPEPVRAVPRPEADAAPEQHPDEEPASLYPDWMENSPRAWAMVIDLDRCIGCNACITACQAENNVPVVGREEVERGREMHWLRVDRYWEGPAEQPLGHFQPLPCMHCEKAPCEVGCPVNATVHGPEGLNQMIYNRCIGTRTCASYCPYKVRRFNFFDYAGQDENEAARPRRNVEVTVRSRGVMEKCTYCTQRISRARIAAEIEQREIRPGEVETACQEMCPTRAIVFGDLRQPGNPVEPLRQSPRHYALLHELGTRPRTTYLARVLPEAARDEEGEHG